MHAGPYSRLYEHCGVIVSRASIQVREPDKLHCPCIPPLQGSSPYNLHKGVFCKGPLARRAESCTQVPQQQHKLQQQATKIQALQPKTARTHYHSVVKDAHHSYRSPVMCSISWVSEANGHKAWLTL